MTGSDPAFHIGALRKNPVLRAIATACVLLGIVFQSFVVQTHVHVPANARPGHITESTAEAPHAGTAPFEGPGTPGDSCCLCQAVLVAGAYLIPASAQIQLPVDFSHFDLIVVQTAAVLFPTSHAWQSRAPPFL